MSSLTQVLNKKFKRQQGIKAQIKANENLKKRALGVFLNQNQLKTLINSLNIVEIHKYFSSIFTVIELEDDQNEKEGYANHLIIQINYVDKHLRRLTQRPRSPQMNSQNKKGKEMRNLWDTWKQKVNYYDDELDRLGLSKNINLFLGSSGLQYDKRDVKKRNKYWQEEMKKAYYDEDVLPPTHPIQGGKRRLRRRTRKKRGAANVDFDGFEPNFRELLRKIDFATSEEQIRKALIDNIKDFIIYDIKNKGKLITGNVKTFSIKESHKTDKWKKEHKTFLSKMKEWGHGSTPSTQIYYQWWRYVLKKCKKAIRKKTPIVGYRVVPGSHCEAWGDAGKKLFSMIDIEYIQGSENVNWDNPKTRKFVDGENSIVHEAKVLAFKEMNQSKGGRKTRKKKGRKHRKRKTRKRRRKKRKTRRR